MHMTFVSVQQMSSYCSTRLNTQISTRLNPPNLALKVNVELTVIFLIVTYMYNNVVAL